MCPPVATPGKIVSVESSRTPPERFQHGDQGPAGPMVTWYTCSNKHRWEETTE